ncbi:DUF501 domain-containing protein [Marinitoga lauensis]|uniref:DUF501 domain-containing protein n=1 Tax=Marinitoga lauensis TaxID=2201189 RepID=UPI00197D1A01|nr:DUF501 domain-containing protein [Marinitoga lauensis]
MDITTPTKKDIEIVEKQINRKPNKIISIPKRCSYGFPQVIESYPLKDGKPFPTLYWLTCPHLIKEVGKLEVLGKIKEWEEEIKNNDELREEYIKAHIEEKEKRNKKIKKEPEWVKNRLENIGIGGISNFESIKCLHLQLASYLGGQKTLLEKGCGIALKRRNVRTASVVYYRDIRTHIVIFILFFFGILSITKNILLGNYVLAFNIFIKVLAILIIRFGLYITSPITDISIYIFSTLILFNFNDFYTNNILFSAILLLSFRDMLRGRKYIFTDSLTGLLNRRYYVEIIPKVIKLKEYIGKGFGIIVLDLDNFKPVNDKFGHKSGDYVLMRVGEIINKSVRKSDLAIRYGGDEFIILVNSGSEKAIDNIIKRIDEKVKNDLKIYNISVSAGKCVKNKNDNITLEEMFEKADNNMYENKKRRKNAR